jgi:hypothetical protein
VTLKEFGDGPKGEVVSSGRLVEGRELPLVSSSTIASTGPVHYANQQSKGVE